MTENVYILYTLKFVNSFSNLGENTPVYSRSMHAATPMDIVHRVIKIIFVTMPAIFRCTMPGT